MVEITPIEVEEVQEYTLEDKHMAGYTLVCGSFVTNEKALEIKEFKTLQAE